MNRTSARITRLATLCLATVVACKPADKPPETSLGQPDLTAESKVALDSGNVLYRNGSAFTVKKADADAKKSYLDALAEYRLSAAKSPKHAAPYFGIYMTARALGDTALADSALAGIRARGGDLPPGAMHSGQPAPTMKSPGNPHAGLPGGVPPKAPGKGQ